MRATIEKRLATASPKADPLSYLLKQAHGEVSAELREHLSGEPSPAAVLLGLVNRTDGLNVILTERARHLPDHAGQVSFPGGRIGPRDSGPIAAALREAEEEVGIRPERVAIAGSMQDTLTGTGFLITPVVGFVDYDFEAVPDRSEVDDVFEVPIDFLLEPGALRTSTRERFGTTFTMFEFDYDGHYVWGATATILSHFIKIIL